MGALSSSLARTPAGQRGRLLPEGGGPPFQMKGKDEHFPSTETVTTSCLGHISLKYQGAVFRGDYLEGDKIHVGIGFLSEKKLIISNDYCLHRAASEPEVL